VAAERGVDHGVVALPLDPPRTPPERRSLVAVARHPEVARPLRAPVEQDRDVLEVALVVVAVRQRRADRVRQRLERRLDGRQVVHRIEEPVLEAHQVIGHAAVGVLGRIALEVEVHLRRAERVEGGGAVAEVTDHLGRHSQRSCGGEELVADAVDRRRVLQVVVGGPAREVAHLGRLTVAAGVHVEARPPALPGEPQGVEHRDRPEAVGRARHQRRLVAQGERREGGRIGLLDRRLGRGEHDARLEGPPRCGRDELVRIEEVPPADGRLDRPEDDRGDQPEQGD
jgi:hypothetical protein